MRVSANLVNGKLIESSSERTADVWNPATGEKVGVVKLSTDAEMAEAIEAARAAAASWGRSALGERTQIFFALRNAVVEHLDELAALITHENGKTLADAQAEIRRGLESIEYACGLPELLKGSNSPNVAGGIDVHSLKQPLGVVGCITPFNFPVMVPLWMLANALACGNTVVLKPSEKTPTSTTRLGEILLEAGLPAGALNIVHGDKSAADLLMNHPEVDAISFIGSTPVARVVYETATAAGKRVQALGGAKNHVLVMPDADMDAAAEGVVSAAFGAAGERCMAISVAVAVGDAADQLAERLPVLIKDLMVGDGMFEGVDLGPLITREHRDRVASYLDKGAEAGATVLVDGRTYPVSQGAGFFLHPSVIDNVTPDMSVYREEIFGPVLSIVRVGTYSEALDLINEHAFGNGAVVYTRDGGTARNFGLDCRAGMLGVNVPIPTPVGWFSFGGWKSSLFGDTHMYGPDGVRFFTRQKVITTRWT